MSRTIIAFYHSVSHNCWINTLLMDSEASWNTPHYYLYTIRWLINGWTRSYTNELNSWWRKRLCFVMTKKVYSHFVYIGMINPVHKACKWEEICIRRWYFTWNTSQMSELRYMIDLKIPVERNLYAAVGNCQQFLNWLLLHSRRTSDRCQGNCQHPHIIPT